MNWRQAVMNWSLRLHDLKSPISWIELPCSINAAGNSWTEGSIHGVSQFMPARAIHLQYREYREYRPINCCTKFAPTYKYLYLPLSLLRKKKTMRSIIDLTCPRRHTLSKSFMKTNLLLKNCWLIFIYVI